MICSILFFYVIIFLAKGRENDDSIPIRSSAVVKDHCPINTDVQLMETVDLLLNEKYGPPSCSCGGTGSWKRVAFLNMTDTTHQCPSNWTLVSTPIRGCGRRSSTCDSAIFSTNGFSYNYVCGKVLGYQKGSPAAFQIDLNRVPSLENLYVDGLSLTHGAPGSRQHIWTFVAALYEQNSNNYNGLYNCECTNINYNWPYEVPSFVGNNYFCETGNAGPGYHGSIYIDDPLWDGQGCGSTSTCCQLNQPPWFCTSLPRPTRDDLELRSCMDQDVNDEDVVVSLIDIYIALR